MDTTTSTTTSTEGAEVIALPTTTPTPRMCLTCANWITNGLDACDTCGVPVDATPPSLTVAIADLADLIHDALHAAAAEERAHNAYVNAAPGTPPAECRQRKDALDRAHQIARVAQGEMWRALYSLPESVRAAVPPF